jgi:hypothetical protein
MKAINKMMLTFLIFFSSVVLAQVENNLKASFNMEGQLGVTSNGKALWYNMGGPAIRFNFSKLSFSIGMFPSLKFEDDAPRPVVVPILGIGPQIHFLKHKRFLLSFPCYYIAARNAWEITGGIGYVLTKPKT